MKQFGIYDGLGEKIKVPKNCNDIGRKITEYRSRNDITRKELARRIRIPIRTLRNIEFDLLKTVPNAHIIFGLSLVLDMEKEEIIKYFMR